MNDMELKIDPILDVKWYRPLSSPTDIRIRESIMSKWTRIWRKWWRLLRCLQAGQDMWYLCNRRPVQLGSVWDLGVVMLDRSRWVLDLQDRWVYGQPEGCARLKYPRCVFRILESHDPIQMSRQYNIHHALATFGLYPCHLVYITRYLRTRGLLTSL